jgi:lipopolysaccharide/colanic/teichoic acid biosynthesis glycosyltransferase
MINGAEKVGPLISKGDDPRITKLGNFLRRYKLDEIPQLLNVVSGEMSLVGPRPEVPKYVEAFRLEYEEILKVRPGITDFASLEFKN